MEKRLAIIQRSRSVIRYLKLIQLFIKCSFLVDLEYRFNFIGLFFLSILDAVWSIAGLLMFFNHRSTIGGWTFNETLVVTGLYLQAYGFVDVVMRPNIADIVEHIRIGTMDYILTKPINSQIHATLRRFRLLKTSSFWLGGTIIIYALVQLHHVPSINQVFVYLLLCGAAVVSLYSAMTILATVSFWAVDVSHIDEFVVSFWKRDVILHQHFQHQCGPSSVLWFRLPLLQLYQPK